MRSNLEDARTYRLRNFAPRRPRVTANLTGTFTVPSNGPELYFFDAGSGVRNIVLPTLSEEFSVLIANIGASNRLDVYNSSNVLQTDVGVGKLKYFFASDSRWVWITGFLDTDEATGLTTELRVVTAAGAQVISASEPGLAINKALASATPITLPLASARGGKPIRLVDWLGTVDIANPVTVTPSGADKINNLSTWEFSSLYGGGAILFPNTVLGGYTIGS